MKKPNGNNRDWFGYLMNFEDAMTEKVKEVLSQDNVTAEQLWDAITSSREGKQYLRELSRLQTSHNSSGVKATIANTIASIDRYIR